MNGLLDVNIEGSLRQIEVPEMIVTKLHDSLASLARMTVHAVVLSHVVYGRFSASAVHTGRQDSFLSSTESSTDPIRRIDLLRVSIATVKMMFGLCG